MVDIAVACVAVAAHVVRVVVALEQAVLPDHPIGSFRDVGPEDGRRHLTVVVGGQQIADVVQQGSDDHFLVGSIAVGASR